MMNKKASAVALGAVLTALGGLQGQERSIDDATDTITVSISEKASYYVVTERVPSEAYPVEISNRGVYDASTGLIKWGPFSGEEPLALTYRLVGPPTRFTDIFGNLRFSLGGFPEQITGDLRLGLNGDDYASWALQQFGRVEGPQTNPFWDADRDGMPNFAERVLVRNPLENDRSFLEYELIPGAMPEVRLTTEVANGQEERVRIQRLGLREGILEAEADLSTARQPQEDSVVLEATDRLEDNEQFYRVLVE
jgi:hypothetical protein